MERLVFWPATVLQAIKRWRDINNYDLEARVDGSESKGKMIGRLEFTSEILQQTPSRVWNGIFGIHDLTKIRCVTPRKQDSSKFVHRKQDFLPVCQEFRKSY